MESNVVYLKLKQQQKENVIKSLRSLLCTILSFVLSIAFVGLAVLSVIEWSCFNKNSFYRNLESSEYYDDVKENIYVKAEAITLPTGLSLEVLNNAIESYEVHRDVKGYIDASFRGETYLADTTLMEYKLEQNIYNYLALEGIEPGQEQKNNIELYVKSITNEYKNSIKMPLLNSLMTIRESFKKIYSIGLATCVITSIIILSMMIKMNKWIHRALRYMTYSTTAAALMITITPAVMLYFKFYKRIQFYPQYFYNFVMTFITNIFNTMLQVSFCLAAISIFLMITIKSMKIKLMKDSVKN